MSTLKPSWKKIWIITSILWLLAFSYKNDIAKAFEAQALIEHTNEEVTKRLITKEGYSVQNLEFYEVKSTQTIGGVWYMIWDIECDRVTAYVDKSEYYLIDNIEYEFEFLGKELTEIIIHCWGLIKRSSYTNQRYLEDETWFNNDANWRQHTAITNYMTLGEKDIYRDPSKELQKAVEQSLNQNPHNHWVSIQVVFDGESSKKARIEQESSMNIDIKNIAQSLSKSVDNIMNTYLTNRVFK